MTTPFEMKKGHKYDKKDWSTEWNEWLKKIKNKIVVNI